MDTNLKELFMALGSALDDRNDKMEDVLKEIKCLKDLVTDKDNLTKELENKKNECTAAQEQIEQLSKSIQTLHDERNTAYECLKKSYEDKYSDQYQLELLQLQEKINQLNGELEQQKKSHLKHISDKETLLQKEKESAESKRDALLKDLGSSYNDRFADLYRRFKESSWAQTDTAMRCFFAEDYPTFFALCGNEDVVKKFHKNLQSIILQAKEDYLKLADELLDFCVVACSAVNKAPYSRQAAANGESYSVNKHVQCGKRDGDRIYVILQGIQKGEQTFLKSFVKVGNGDEG